MIIELFRVQRVGYEDVKKVNVKVTLEQATEAQRVSRYEGHLESKERFAIQRYLLITGKKQNMQVLSHTFTYFST